MVSNTQNLQIIKINLNILIIRVKIIQLSIDLTKCNDLTKILNQDNLSGQIYDIVSIFTSY